MKSSTGFRGVPLGSVPLGSAGFWVLRVSFPTGTSRTEDFEEPANPEPREPSGTLWN